MPTLTTEQSDALARAAVESRYFIWIEARDPETGNPDPVGFHDHLGTITVGGRNYNGSGKVGQVVTIAAASDLSIPEMRITASGIDPLVLSTFEQKRVDQAAISLSFGIIDVDSGALVGPLVKMFDGFVDDIDIRIPPSGDPGSITLICESTSRELTIKSTETRSHESQQARQSGDEFFKYADTASTTKVFFGMKDARVEATK